MTPVLVAVGTNHALIDAPGRLDLDVFVCCEQGGEPGSLLLGEQPDTGVQGPSGGVERVALVAAMAVDGLLDPTPAPVQGVTGQADHVEGIHDRDRVGELLGGGGLEPAEPRPIATTSTPFRHVSGRAASQVLNACLERPSTMSSSLAGPVPSRIGVRSMITVTYLSPRRVCLQTCSSTPTTFTPSNRVTSLIRTRLPSARTASFAVSHATPRPSATRATVRWATTIASSAHRSPRRESFARGAAAREVSWRHTCPQPSHR